MILFYLLSLWIFVVNSELTADDIQKIQGKPIGVGMPQLLVDEIDWFPQGEIFFKKYVIPKKPLIMRDAAKLSPAFYKWTDDYFISLDIAEEDLIEYERGKKENRSDDLVFVNFKDFLRIYNDSDIYMVQPVPRYLESDLLLPCPLQCPTHVEITASILWFSSGGTKSVLHTDNNHNIICVYRGKKEFLLIDSKYSKYYHIDVKIKAYSTVDVDAVDYIKYSGLAKVEYYNVTMEPGDCLYIPYKWAHQVRSYGSNVAVNLWWENVDLKPEDVKCAAKCDMNLMFDKMNVSAKSHSRDIWVSLVSTVKALMKNKPDMTLDMLTSSILTSDNKWRKIQPEMRDEIRKSMLQLFNTMDKNKDNKLDVKEIKECNEDCFEEHNDLLELLENLREEDDEEDDDDEMENEIEKGDENKNKDEL